MATLNRVEVVRWRRSLRLTQAEFYGRAKINQSTGSRYESGATRLSPSVELALLAAHFVPAKDIEKFRTAARGAR